MQCRGPPARARPWQRPRTPPLLLPLLLLAAVAAPLPQRAASEAAPDCAALLQQYEAWNKKAAVPYGGDNMVYFLHVPRCGAHSSASGRRALGGPSRGAPACGAMRRGAARRGVG